MLRATDIMPITEFTRNYKKVIAMLKKAGRPFVLTIDGKPAVVIQDANAFDQTLERLDARYAGEAVSRAIEDLRPSMTAEQLQTKLSARRVKSHRRAGRS
jgi:PHD/YefM family antitoxin component YafN of YafNO toxin-antitoxin module